MIKILVVCGNGLGSSFMMELNVKKILKELEFTADVDHCDLTSAKSYKADIIVGTKDITSQLVGQSKELVELNNILDLDHMKSKLLEAIKNFNKKF